MISVENRDGTKGLEQRFGTKKREMDESELEGEACSYQEEDDTNVDPDVTLSYLDEKLQNVLGHFKKDFEGVVSAENLGAKYGTYGSFLPTYRRSPVLCHSRSPPRLQNHYTPHSLCTSRVEGRRHNSLVHTNVSQSIKHGSASSNVYKPLSQSDQCKSTARTQSREPVEESIPKPEVRDQRTLKVRIKVGSDNLSVNENAAIYSGLGLDGSPPSSFDDSPIDSEGLHHGPQSDIHESPTQILLMMTCFPLFGGCLLSPLPDQLMQLGERPKLLEEILTQSSSKVSEVNSVIGRLCESVEDNKVFSVGNSVKLLDKKSSSLQVKNDSEKNHIGFDLLMKETDIDAVSCEQLVTSALKLPLLSNAYNTMADKALSTENIYPDAEKRVSLELLSVPASLSGKTDEKANTAGSLVDKTATPAPKELMTDSGNIGGRKGETASISTNTDTVGSKCKKASKTGQKDPVKQKAEKYSTNEKRVGLSSRKEQLPSGDKKKLKKNQVHGFAARKMVMESDNDIEPEHTSRQKILSKNEDKYQGLFGEVNEQEGHVMDSSDVPCGDKGRTPDALEKNSTACENIPRVGTNCFENHKEVISCTGLRGSCLKASAESGRPISDQAPGGVDADDNWVCCDKCQKWRLLPPGFKVDNLPDKWLCSMMTWLPDMNRCSISEEETHKAFRARYLLLVENPKSLHDHLGSLATEMHSADTLDSSKMIDKLRKSSRSSFQDSPNQISCSIKKKQHRVKDQTLTEAEKSPLVNMSGFQQLMKSGETSTETNQHRRSHKHRAGCDSDGGYAKLSKIKSKRVPGQNFCRTSKKTKTRSMQSGDSDWQTAHNQDNEMLGVNWGYVVGTGIVETDEIATSEFFPSRKSKHDLGGDSLDMLNRSKFQVEALTDVGSLPVSKSDNTNATPKKRKTGDSLDPSISTPFSELTPDNEQLGGKKHRVSKSEGKESSASKKNGKAEKKGKSILRQNSDITEYPRKDSSSAHPIVAPTLSSSKVSGSLKAKTRLHELKASPVESVSSFPLRISNADKITLANKIIVQKDNVQDADKLTTGSLRKCSNVDYEGCSDQYDSIRKDGIKTGRHDMSVEPSMVDQQKDGIGVLQHENGLAEISRPKLQYDLSTNGCAGSLDPNNKYPSEARASGRCIIETTKGAGLSVSQSGKSQEDSSALYEDKNHESNSQMGVKIFETLGSLQHHLLAHKEKERDNKSNVQEKLGSSADKAEKDAIHCSQELSVPKPKAPHDYDKKRSSKKVDMENPENLLTTSTSEKSQHLPSHHVEKSEISNRFHPQQCNGGSTSSSDARASDLPKEPHPSKGDDSQNDTYNILCKNPTSNGHMAKNSVAPSPLRRDAFSQAASNALKEAKSLKHHADRLKNAGSAESTGMYFEAALKFLHGASLLESGKTENAKHADIIQYMQIYSSTAKLCKFCAHEYEKSNDMATAALAYKCMEVAYLRVIYSSHHSASRDCHKLQTVLQMVPGESPSSSASDIDNLNHSTTGEKTLLPRNAGSPQHAANFVIAARNRPNFSRLLNFAQDANFAMEASRKSRVAFAAAKVGMDQADVIAALKTALDFNFNDVEELLLLVRLAKEATNR